MKLYSPALLGAPPTVIYAGDGLRRTKQTASGTTTYVWDGSDYLGEIS